VSSLICDTAPLLKPIRGINEIFLALYDDEAKALLRKIANGRQTKGLLFNVL
jgi:hypothetical protein